MTDSKINNILIPNVSKLPGQKKVDVSKQLPNVKNRDEFKKILEGHVSKTEDHGIKLSTHAAKRLQERNLEVDGAEFLKLKNAIGQLKNKGGKDSLVITEKAAYIVDVNNSKIVTAMDKNNMKENVFTKIDSTLFVG